MKVFLGLFALFLLVSCKVGEFTPERHALYDLNRPDCEKTPEKCINGYPW